MPLFITDNHNDIILHDGTWRHMMCIYMFILIDNLPVVMAELSYVMDLFYALSYCNNLISQQTQVGLNTANA